MQRIVGYIHWIYQLICPCLQAQPQVANQNHNSLPLLQEVQLKIINQFRSQRGSSSIQKTQDVPQVKLKNRSVSNHNKSERESKKIVPSQKDHIENINSQQSSQKERLKSSRQSFHTVKSFSSRGRSMRDFKLLKKLSQLSLKKSQDEYKSVKSDTKQFLFNKQQTNIIDFQKQKAILIDLMQEQYPKDNSIVKIDKSTLLQIENQNLINSIVNKLQDYYTFYSQVENFTSDQNQNSSFTYKNREFNCSFTKQSQTMSNNHVYMTLCTFSLAVNYMSFIKWFNKLQNQAIYHNFQKIYISSTQNIPILSIVQFAPDSSLNGRTTYHALRVMQSAKFQASESQYFLEMEITFLKEQPNFQRLIRIELAEKGLVEIYTESEENITGKQQVYFKNRWKKFQTKLTVDGMI